MHADVVALLAVQADDVSIHALERGMAQLMPKVNALAAECERTKVALAQAHGLVEAERKRRRDVEMRIETHRQLYAKNQTVLNAITSQREATAATAQLEQVAKIITDEEREMSLLAQRIDELEKLAEDRQVTLREFETAKAEAEASVAEDRAKIDAELGEIRTRRDARTRDVPRSLLSKYDRIRSKKRVHAIFPLRGASCSHCDTALPLQRRTEMSHTGATEVCQGCGVLLYATE